MEQLTAIGRAYIAFSQEFPVYFEVMARCELLSPAPDAVSNEGAAMIKGDDCRNMMVAVIETGVRDGSIRSDVGDPKIVSTALWGFMHGVLQLASTKANHLAHDGIATRDLVEHALLMATRSVETVN